MNGLSSDIGWDEPEERGRWVRARASLLLATAGLSWASLCIASGLAASLYLTRRGCDRRARQPGDDL